MRKRIFIIDEICGTDDYYNLNKFMPQIPTNFYMEVLIKLRYKDNPDWDTERFTVTVASPLGYASHKGILDKEVWQDKVIFMKSYNYDTLKNYIGTIVESNQSTTAAQTVLKLSKYFRMDDVSLDNSNRLIQKIIQEKY